MYVVADLYQVVELDAVFNHRVLQGTAVYACVGANFDIVTNAYGTELLDFFPALTVGCKAEAIGTNHHARMQDAARTYGAIFTD